MASGLRQTGLDYQYEIVDMHRVDCARLLQKRFGPLPPRIQTRLEAASTTELEAWAEQVLDGLGLEQMFPDA
ncbi:hypothetical protein B1757_11500 [Acidithiobacillus marinus]|uniref:DUF4351 domain-containing protein n=1 Tax=Acidithiobacillus marinus TaxID=187490 RepID=A0A2I1DJR9_9PROT|nr:DUF4351 domain-containing protein [Acidithiobacillus marinus]PKY10118.1 hypothetical protein B1757_11500 [Acidithiobacillus marinus]